MGDKRYDSSLAGMELAAGQMYGDRYRIVLSIGKGGMGRVYLAEDTRLGGKPRALKLTRPLPDERGAFMPEAQLLSVLDHPHLPAIVDYFPPDETGVACIVMDYVAGDTLSERFDRYERRLSFPFVLSLLIDLCDVLAYLHSHNPPIVFRDLKPSNVLLDRHNKAILVDFGIARRYRGEMLSDTLQLGTPGFAAPEQLRGEQSDGRTDLYGLGALAYYLLSGGRFAIRHRGNLKRALQEDVPAWFVRLLDRLLANDPERRTQSAEELRGELEMIRQETTGGNPPPSGQDEHNNRHKATIVAITSAYPGAGATFASMALSGALSRGGVAHALVECPGREGELYALFDGARKMPKGAVFARTTGGQAAVPAWRNGSAVYYPLEPGLPASDRPDASFAGWLSRIGMPVVVLDASSCWEQPQMREWLVESVDCIGMVADCYPAKWSERRQTASIEFHQAASRKRVPWTWIANRDQLFPDRKSWLSLFPGKPEVYLPDLPSLSMLRAMWHGEGLPSDQRTTDIVDRAFHKWIKELRSADFSSL